MTEYTDAQLLVYVREAIKKRLNGEVVKSYTAQGVRLDRDPIGDLWELERKLSERNTAANGPSFTRIEPK